MSNKEKEPLIIIAKDRDNPNKIAIKVNSDLAAWGDEKATELDRLYWAIQTLLIGVGKISADIVTQGEDVSRVIPIIIEDLIRYIQASMPNAEIDTRLIDIKEARSLGIISDKTGNLPS